jgi:hypothetical protein
MLKLKELCANMAATGRKLTPRKARDWWTKGLLQRPRRRGLGPGRGTETFWTEPHVMQRACAVYDLLAEYPRVDVAILGLWLRGFPLDLGVIREVYRRSISRHFRSARGRSRRPLHEWVHELADGVARQTARNGAAPREVRRTIADLAVEFLGVFYGLREEVAIGGLASRWKNATPYLGGAAWAEVHLQDDDLATWAQYLEEMASLPAQREAIDSATDYELIRARRLVRLAFGYFGRVARAIERGEELREFAQRFLLIFGRPAVPVLIAVLRKEALRREVASFLLDIGKRLPRSLAELKAI